MGNKKKSIILVIAIICFGLLLVGGTYAFMTFTANITNANYNVASTCFEVDFTAGDAITGTLFQSSTPKGGLSGTVKMNVNEECSVAGEGTITLNVGVETDSILLSEGALKYAVYEYIDEEPVSSGTITKTGNIDIYDGFVIPFRIPKNYYIYVWLDGTIADNDYIDVAFTGNIHASAAQTEECVITYVEGDVLQADAEVWTQTITRGQPFALPLIGEKGYATYSLYDDPLECHHYYESVTFSCGTVLLASPALCLG